MQDISQKSYRLQYVLKITALLCGVLLIIAAIQSKNSPFINLSFDQFLQSQLHLLVQLKWFIGVLFIAFGLMLSPKKIFVNGVFSEEKDLNHDAYKLYLVKKYGIEKNPVLDQLVCQEKLFPSVNEALIYAHQLECPDHLIEIEPVAVINQTSEKPQDDISLIKSIDGVFSGASVSKSLNAPTSSPSILRQYSFIFLAGILLLAIALAGLFYANTYVTKESPASIPAQVTQPNSDQVLTNSIPEASISPAEASANLPAKSALVPINERWIGTWTAEGNKQKLFITQSNFKYGNDDFTWLGVRPKGVIQCCPAFYEGSTSKAELLERIQQQSANASVKADNQKIVELVKALSEGSFKKIVLADPFLRKYFFIYDQSFVYRINRDLGDNADLIVEQFKKQE